MSIDASQSEVFEMEIEGSRIPRSLVLACAFSIGLHVLGFGVLSLFRLAQRLEVFSTVSSLENIDESESRPNFDTTVADEVGTEGEIASFGGSFAPSHSAANVLTRNTNEDVEKAVESNFSMAIPTTTELPRQAAENVMDRVKTSGTTEHAGGVDGAIDRLSWEISQSLREKKTLVVWLFDVSPSLSSRRTQIADRVETVYNQLTQLNVASDRVLKSAVAVYGPDTKILTDKPLDDPAELVKVVRKIKSESSGDENTFSAVHQVAKKFQSYIASEHRRIMIIIVTDEAGSDPVNLEQAIVTCRNHSIRCYCVGDSAPFGRDNIEADFTLEDGEEVIGVMQKGPESFFPELVRLGYWGTNGHDLEDISSGFGPYGLTRLCSETNGLYLIADKGRGKFSFDPAVMRNYTPDYRPIKFLEQDLRQNRAKAALVEGCSAVLGETQRRKVLSISMPRLDFRAENDTVLRQELTEAQKPIADLDLSLDSLLRILEQGEKDRPKIKESRWKASYDLAMGRTLALRVRAFGYNTMLAEMKANPKKFDKSGNNKWNLVPSKDVNSGAAVKKLASRANEYLSHVIDDHPGTPWAIMAEREKSVPLGWEWKESHYDPNPPMVAAAPKAGPKIIEVIDPVTKKKTQKQVSNEKQKRDI